MNNLLASKFECGNKPIDITGKLKPKTIKTSHLLNGPAKQSRSYYCITNYCIITLLTLNEKD